VIRFCFSVPDQRAAMNRSTRAVNGIGLSVVMPALVAGIHVLKF